MFVGFPQIGAIPTNPDVPLCRRLAGLLSTGSTHAGSRIEPTVVSAALRYCFRWAQSPAVPDDPASLRRTGAAEALLAEVLRLVPPTTVTAVRTTVVAFANNPAVRLREVLDAEPFATDDYVQLMLGSSRRFHFPLRHRKTRGRSGPWTP